MKIQIAFPIAAVLILVSSGCDRLTGAYVLDVDKMLSGVGRVPVSAKTRFTLPEYKDHIRGQYSGKELSLTNDEPHTFLFPVDLDGSVKGLFRGGWKRNDDGSVLIYRWVSGSMYHLWGKATRANGALRVELAGPDHDEAVVLYFARR